MKYIPLFIAALIPALVSAVPLPETMAPDFETTAVLPVKGKPEGRVVDNFKLSSLFGKKRILLLSYPQHCTYICATELIAIKDKLDRFRELGFEVLVLATDGAPMFKSKPTEIGKAGFIKLLDPEAKILKQYGLQSEDGLSFRATFYMGIDGKVRITEVLGNTIGRDVDDMLRKAATIKFVEEDGGLLTLPAQSALYFN